MTRAVWLGIAAATALIVLLTDGLAAPARIWTAILMAPLPAMMIVQAQQLRDLDELPRRAAYFSSIISLWLLAAATAGVAFLAGFTHADLGLFPLPLSRLAALAAVLVLGGTAVLFLFRLFGADETPVLRALLPHSRQEKLIFVAVSVSAGVCEEFVFRGFLQHALTTATGSPWIALALASGAFGIVHAYQSAVGAARATLIGVLLGLPVVLGFGLYPSIAAHTLVDVLSGIFLARWLLR